MTPPPPPPSSSSSSSVSDLLPSLEVKNVAASALEESNGQLQQEASTTTTPTTSSTVAPSSQHKGSSSTRSNSTSQSRRQLDEMVDVSSSHGSENAADNTNNDNVRRYPRRQTKVAQPNTTSFDDQGLPARSSRPRRKKSNHDHEDQGSSQDDDLDDDDDDDNDDDDQSDDDGGDDDLELDEDESDVSKHQRRGTSRKHRDKPVPVLRTSSRSTKFTHSMAEPSDYVGSLRGGGTEPQQKQPITATTRATATTTGTRKRSSREETPSSRITVVDELSGGSKHYKTSKGGTQNGLSVDLVLVADVETETILDQSVTSEDAEASTKDFPRRLADDMDTAAHLGPSKSPARRHTHARRSVRNSDKRRGNVNREIASSSCSSLVEPTSEVESRAKSTNSKTSNKHGKSNRRGKKTSYRSESASDQDRDEEIDDQGADPEDSYDDDDGTDVDDDHSEDEPLKVQRILACRTETRATWNEICRSINTSEIDYGSRWFQGKTTNKDQDDDAQVYEERFLIKWYDLSYLHCSWETREDLMSQIETAKTYLNTFFRKSRHGRLLSVDERCDGDYFDPGYTEIERIMEVQWDDDDDDDKDKDNPNDLQNDDGDHRPHRRKKHKADRKQRDQQRMTPEAEDQYTTSSFGMVLDKSHPGFDQGSGRQFLIKWRSLPYSEATYEFERDLILADIDYKETLKSFWRQRKYKPSREQRQAYLRQGQEAFKRLYKIFGAKSTGKDEQREAATLEYQQQLQQMVYPNGGQVRDYQAEGIAWLMANFVNQRSSILADEMGLGKTLQTAATCSLLLRELNRGRPILVVVPLSTISHWQREFNSWTDLNVIVYHGSAEDRDLIRQHEFVYESDRPSSGSLPNQLYLRKCLPKRGKNSPSWDSPWMVEVVITTPEMLVADDFAELSVIPWELLVVDEAHRLKNHNSKLAVHLRNDRFQFRNKILLTGTPIQNDVQEFWTLLNFIDPAGYDDLNTFLERYGDMKSKERVDELHEEIRPYILRRLKEDVEKSVPPKEETLIEVELTVSQKQYYRALYEKNVKFLHKNKKKALDGPSLNNLAMQLRKCCNHLFLLNGVEEEIRRQHGLTLQGHLMDVDLLVKGSGKLVLLDKLLPRLKEEGHRVLIFSQFKIMLDLLEDYLVCRQMKFERIDGSIMGKKRQQAIDRFQAPPSVDGKELPFIMMLSTRAGGVGINLTAADTCIIYDSDWNPQNDLQAQARCHRIGQTKSVKVYRLLTRNTYEMQMFHMSSLKMGLDQAVLKGFESGSTSEGALTKAEVERLLRHGAYDIFNEDKAGSSEAASNDFVELDIDSILARRSRTVIHENTGSQSGAAGGTFSKARFQISASSGVSNSNQNQDDVDIEDPDFWKKMLGEEALMINTVEDLGTKRRRRTEKNYSEIAYQKQLDPSLLSSDEDDSGTDDEDEATEERTRWGGPKTNDWVRDDGEALAKSLVAFGYREIPTEQLLKRIDLRKTYDTGEIHRMLWAMILVTFTVAADEEADAVKKRELAAFEKEKQMSTTVGRDGGVLAMDKSIVPFISSTELKASKAAAFKQLWKSNKPWAQSVLEHAVAYAKECPPRTDDVIRKALGTDAPALDKQVKSADSIFAETVWPCLRSRGWKSSMVSDGEFTARVMYEFENQQFSSFEAATQGALVRHPELANMLEPVLLQGEMHRKQTRESFESQRTRHLALCYDDVEYDDIHIFLTRYAPLPLLTDRKKSHRVRLHSKILSSCGLIHKVQSLVKRALVEGDESKTLRNLESSFGGDRRTWLPHPLWKGKHDTQLILAIAKHGWVGQDACCRAIVSDTSIKWGLPFARPPSKAIDDRLMTQEYKDEIRSVAERAMWFLNGCEGESEAAIFRKDIVVRAYGLTKDARDPARWVVEPQAIHRSVAYSPEHDALVNLPSKKDLVKRAKIVLGKSTSFESIATENNNSDVDNGIPALDLYDLRNVLLAEMLRAILKASNQGGLVRKIFAAAAIEAQRRLERGKELWSMPDKKLHEDVSSNELAVMAKVASSLEGALKHLGKQPVQCKNVVRAILGEEPLKSRSDEAIFPVSRPQLLADVNLASVSPSVQSTSTSSLEEKFESSQAIESATAKFKIVNATKTDVLTLASDPATLLLTEIETLILTVLCSTGIPVWGDALEMSFINAADTFGERRLTQLTWIDVGVFLQRRAKLITDKASDVVRRAKLQVQRGTGNAAVAAQSMLHQAEAFLRAKQSTLATAQEYSDDAECLAKKSVLLLNAIGKAMVQDGTNSCPNSVQSSLGEEVIAWFKKTLRRWAEPLDLLDDHGQALALTASDFLVDLPKRERDGISFCCVADFQDARKIFRQAAAMSRLRTIVSSNDNEALLSKMQAVARERWRNEPLWWHQEPVLHDMILVKRILDTGFTDGLLWSKDSFGYTGSHSRLSYSQDRALTKRVLQLRVYRVIHELHKLDASAGLRNLDNPESRTQQLPTRSLSEHIGLPSVQLSKPPQQDQQGSGGESKPDFSQAGELEDDDDVVEIVSPPPPTPPPPPSNSADFSDVEIIDITDSAERHPGTKQKYLLNAPDNMSPIKRPRTF